MESRITSCGLYTKDSYILGKPQDAILLSIFPH